MAVKKLTRGDKKAFEQEVKMLRILGREPEPQKHIGPLLYTYRKGSNYHLMLPLADADLRQDWKQEIPKFDHKTILWLLKQMAGIVEALNYLHDFQPTISISDDVNVLQKNVNSSETFHSCTILLRESEGCLPAVKQTSILRSYE